jgi:hypothetical protein
MLFPVRKMLGIIELERLGNISQDLALQNREARVAHLNRLTFGVSDPEELEASVLCQRARRIVSALTPQGVRDGHYIRVGRSFDGGYVMLDHFPRELEGAYSFGVNDDVSWDLQIAARELPVELYDHTIPALPQTHPRFRFHRNGICGFRKAPSLLTLSDCLRQNGHAAARALLLKMDVEGWEWDVLSECSTDLLGKFQQIVVEYHGLTQAVYQPRRFEETIKVLAKLNQTHQVIHVHGNSLSSVVAIKRLILPDLLEVTYVRRSDFADRLVNDRRVFPTDLDEPTFGSSPDLYLGRFDGEI